MKNIKILFFAFSIVISLLIGNVVYINKVNVYYPEVESELASINKYYIYGQVFNIEGSLNKRIDKEKIKGVALVLMTKKIEIYINTTYEINDHHLDFKISEKINAGINLDNIDVGKYFLVLKLHYKNNEVEYYSFINNTEYSNLDYYTITKNNENNYVNIKFISKLMNIQKLTFLEIDVYKVNLLRGVYDIVIDPGHGGIDSGAVVDNIYESSIVLKIGIQLKEELEKLGFRVKLTRTGDYNPGGDGIDPYWNNGRVNIANNVKAKYIFSIHLNSAPYKMKKGGVEIYSPPNANYDLAKSIASNIVKYAKTRYSPNQEDKIDDGVYVRTFTSEEITQSIVDAQNYNYKPYNINTQTAYHYIIREPGGIVTNAYVDGRYKKYNKNHNYKSNIGVESYLVELGFMVNSTDLHNMVHNKRGYALGIAEGIKEFLYNSDDTN